MALNPSALAADDSGHAATVQASGGNKTKLQKGVAVFKDVKITAESAGDYLLRVASGSRKVPHDNSLAGHRLILTSVRRAYAIAWLHCWKCACNILSMLMMSAIQYGISCPTMDTLHWLATLCI